MCEQVQAKHPQPQQNSSDTVLWFLTGLATGVVIGLLYAPRSGSAMRDVLSEASREWYGRSLDFYEKGMLAVDDAAELFERGRKMASGGLE